MAGAGGRLGKPKKAAGKEKAAAARARRPAEAGPSPGEASSPPPGGKAQAPRPDRSPEEGAPLKAIGSRTQLERSLREAGERLVVVFFSGSWCETCRGLEPAMGEMAQLHRPVVFYEVNVDKSEDTAEACDIVHIPTIQFYKLGKKVAEILDDSRESVERKIIELK